MLPDLLHHCWEFKITHPSKVAHRLEVDEVAFARVQGAVPVTIVGVIVTHSEGTGLRKAAGRQLSCVVVRGASSLGLTMRHGQRETLLKPQFPLHFLPCLLLYNYLVRAGHRGRLHL